jgi:spore germination cell wall hydrolase CwlJ-like protein
MKILYTALLLLFASSAYGSEAAILTIIYEAAGEPYAGQVAVGNTIRTRMAERGQTAEQVVYARNQFSCWNTKPTRKPTAQEYETAKRAWEESSVWEFNHYAHYKIDNYWTRKAVKKERICNHVFYKL